jgi:hypothetical protein
VDFTLGTGRRRARPPEGWSCAAPCTTSGVLVTPQVPVPWGSRRRVCGCRLDHGVSRPERAQGSGVVPVDMPSDGGQDSHVTEYAAGMTGRHQPESRSKGRLTPPTSSSPTPSPPRTPGKTPVPRETATAGRHPEMAAQRREAGRSVGITAPIGPVRGLFCPRPWPFRARPWPARPREPGTHGRIADGGSPNLRLERRTRWSAGGDSGRRSVL